MDCNSILASMCRTPGYVGADLSTLTGAAGVIAVKRIFKELSERTLILPDALEVSKENIDTPMVVDSTPHITTIEASLPIRPFSSLVSELSSSSACTPGHHIL